MQLHAERLRELLDYDPSTGIFRWRVSRGRVKAGQLAGTPHNQGYWRIRIDGVYYLAHRLAFLWMLGTWPSDLVDHEDEVRTNNQWDNLRDATESTNKMNRGKQSNSTTGVKGVYRNQKGKPFRAAIGVEGRQFHLGMFNTIEEAAIAYNNAVPFYHGEFAQLNRMTA